jgi:hypothetical protein
MLEYLIPETASAPKTARQRYLRRTRVLMLGFIVFFTVSALWDLGAVGQALMIGSVACFAGVIFEFVVLMKALDELQHRIHMTALAISGGLVASVATVWGILAFELAITEPSIAFALPVLAIGYYVTLFFVSRHYA